MNSVVEAFQQFRMDGNIIPHSWYQSPKLAQKNGKPNLVAITLLADVVYWYRPVELRDEVSGVHLGYRQKFGADKLQKNYRKWGDGFGFTLRQVEDAMAFLKVAELVTVERRMVMTEMGTFPNCAFIEPVFANIQDLTYPPDEKATAANGSPVRTGDVPRSNGRLSPVERGSPSRSSARHGTPEGEHTKTPSKNSKKTSSGEAAEAAPDGSASLFEKSPEQKETDQAALSLLDQAKLAEAAWPKIPEADRAPWLERAKQELVVIHAGTGINPRTKLIEARAKNLYEVSLRGKEPKEEPKPQQD